MHYVQYLPGTIAHITEHKTRHGCEDVNRLSRAVCKFNSWLRTFDYFKEEQKPGNHFKSPSTLKVQNFVNSFNEFQL